MGYNSNRAAYLDKDKFSSIKIKNKKRSPIAFLVSALLAAMILVISLPLFTSAKDSTVAQASAGGIFCNEPIGLFMNSPIKWGAMIASDPIYPNLSSRTFTLEEVAGGSLFWSNYYGVGEGDNFWVANSEEVTGNPKAADLAKYGNFDTIKSTLEEPHTILGCGVSSMTTTWASSGLLLASGISSLAGWVATMAFNSDIVCPADSKASVGPCIDLLKIIGGSGGSSGDGIIGTLTSSIYLPLVLIAVAIVGMWVAYNGLVKRKYRESLFGALWLALSFIMGLALLLNPQLLVKAPMEASNVVTACVVGAFSGDNCFTGGSTGSSGEIVDASDAICKSDSPSASAGQKTALVVNSLKCVIWKAFVLEPYAQGAFGTSLSDLDITSDGMKATLDAAGINGENLCIRLRATGSAESFANKPIVFSNSSGDKICNLAVYEIFMKTGVTMEGKTLKNADPDWYNVVVTAANDDGLWNQWTGTSGAMFHKFASSAIAIIASILGGWLILLTSVMALVYYLSAIILVAFAPIFFLFGVHPGRGKKLLLGWMEQIVSGMLKYIASAVFLIVTIAFYGAVLGNASDMGMTLLFVILLSAALFVYRKEIINLLGRANMGGEKLSSSLADRASQGLSSIGKRTGTLATGAIGGAAGAVLANGGAPGGLRAAGAGLKDGIKRDLKRGRGVIGNATSAYDRATVDNKQVLAKRMQDAKKDIEITKKDHNNANVEYTESAAELSNSRAEHEQTADLVVAQNKKFEGHQQAITHAIHDSENPDKNEGGQTITPEYAEFTKLLARLEGLKIQHQIAVANGDQQGAADLEREISHVNALQADQKELFNSKYLDEESAAQAWAQNEDIYANNYRKVADRYTKEYNEETGKYEGEGYSSKTHLSAFDRLGVAKANVEQSEANLARLRDVQESTLDAYTNAIAREDAYTNAYENWRPGEGVKQSDIDKIAGVADKNGVLQGGFVNEHAANIRDSYAEDMNNSRNGVSDITNEQTNLRNIDGLSSGLRERYEIPDTMPNREESEFDSDGRRAQQEERYRAYEENRNNRGGEGPSAPDFANERGRQDEFRNGNENSQNPVQPNIAIDRVNSNNSNDLNTPVNIPTTPIDPTDRTPQPNITVESGRSDSYAADSLPAMPVDRTEPQVETPMSRDNYRTDPKFDNASSPTNMPFIGEDRSENVQADRVNNRADSTPINNEPLPGIAHPQDNNLQAAPPLANTLPDINRRNNPQPIDPAIRGNEARSQSDSEGSYNQANTPVTSERIQSDGLRNNIPNPEQPREPFAGPSYNQAPQNSENRSSQVNNESALPPLANTPMPAPRLDDQTPRAEQRREAPRQDAPLNRETQAPRIDTSSVANQQDQVSNQNTTDTQPETRRAARNNEYNSNPERNNTRNPLPIPEERLSSKPENSVTEQKTPGAERIQEKNQSSASSERYIPRSERPDARRVEFNETPTVKPEASSKENVNREPEAKSVSAPNVAPTRVDRPIRREQNNANIQDSVNEKQPVNDTRRAVAEPRKAEPGKVEFRETPPARDTNEAINALPPVERVQETPKRDNTQRATPSRPETSPRRQEPIRDNSTPKRSEPVQRPQPQERLNSAEPTQRSEPVQKPATAPSPAQKPEQERPRRGNTEPRVETQRVTPVTKPISENRQAPEQERSVAPEVKNERPKVEFKETPKTQERPSQQPERGAPAQAPQPARKPEALPEVNNRPAPTSKPVETSKPKTEPRSEASQAASEPRKAEPGRVEFKETSQARDTQEKSQPAAPVRRAPEPAASTQAPMRNEPPKVELNSERKKSSEQTRKAQESSDRWPNANRNSSNQGVAPEPRTTPVEKPAQNNQDSKPVNKPVERPEKQRPSEPIRWSANPNSNSTNRAPSERRQAEERNLQPPQENNPVEQPMPQVNQNSNSKPVKDPKPNSKDESFNQASMRRGAVGDALPSEARPRSLRNDVNGISDPNDIYNNNNSNGNDDTTPNGNRGLRGMFGRNRPKNNPDEMPPLNN